MVLSGLARKYAEASSHVVQRLRRRRRRGCRRRRGRPWPPALPCTTSSSVSVAVGHALDADEQDEDDGRGDEVHQRPGGDGDVPLPDRLLVVDAVAGVLGDLLLRRHAADLAEAAERDDADAVLRLAPGAPQRRRREADVELLDAHAERLGGDEVAELVDGDEEREAEDGDQPHPLPEQQRREHGAAEQQRPRAQRARRRLGRRRSRLAGLGPARRSARGSSRPRPERASSGVTSSVMCVAGYPFEVTSTLTPPRARGSPARGRRSRGSRRQSVGARRVAREAPRLGVAGVHVVERRHGFVAEPVEARLDDLGDAEERQPPGRGTPRRRPRWRR